MLVLFVVLAILSLIGIIWIKYNNPFENKSIEPLNMQAINQEESIQAIIPFQEIYEAEQAKTIQNPPEIIRLTELVSEFKKDQTKWDNVLAIGDLYRTGSYPRYLPDPDMAIKIFKICAMCPSGEIAGIAQSKYVESRTTSIDIEDKAGIKMPESYGNQICELAEMSIKTTPWSLFEKPKHIKKKEVKAADTALDNIFNFMAADADGVNGLLDGGFLDGGFQDNQAQVIDVPAYRQDRQNVHDHAVVSTTKQNIAQLNTNTNYNIEQIENNILESTLSDKEKIDAIHVLSKLKDSTHSSYNVTELEVLGGVWDKVKKNKDHSEILFKQLASGVEDGYVVCSSGKIARIMGTLDGIDDTQVQTRPMWVVREELGTLAAKIRDNNPDPHEAAKQFEKTAREEYINKLGFKENIMNPIISEYSNYI